MLENKIKHALKRGEAVFGLGLTFPIDLPTLRILANCGVEWLFLDMEHGSGDISELLNVAQIADLLGMCGVARIPNLDYHWVARSLDTGLLSVMVPRVESKEQAELAVQWVKHFPVGVRGMGSPSQFSYAPLTGAERVEISNRETMVIVQIETVKAVENVESIASVPGVDVLFIGPFDMSLTVGKPGDVACEENIEQFRKICPVAREHGLAVGIVCATHQVKFYYDMGIRLFSIGTALGHMRTGLQATEAEFRKLVSR